MALIVPALFGLSFIGFIKVMTVDQLVGILITPIEPAFIAVWLAFSLWYFPRYIQPVTEFLEQPDKAKGSIALERMRNFPLRFWFIFLLYLITAPASVILSAEIYTDYVAQPVDWFRIHLVALIVSIIVGLPIFFRMLDLFGRVVGPLELTRPHITIKTKVFLIGALVPLLIDTMIVQYYWTRTGFFTYETFFVWLLLEILAIVGSLIFTRSFGQSLSPLVELANQKPDFGKFPLANLQPCSTDEIGVLTRNFQQALDDLRAYSEILELSNQLLRETGGTEGLKHVSDIIVRLTHEAMHADSVFLMLYDDTEKCLSCVASTEGNFNADGQFKIELTDASMPVLTFNKGETCAISDVQNDDRCSSELKKDFHFKSAIATPLILDGNKAGVLMAVHHESIHVHSQKDILLIEVLAREAALAINTQKLKLERAEAIGAKRERDELISLLMQSTEEGIYGVDANGNCMFINSAAIKMLGYTQESDVLGKSCHELIHQGYDDGHLHPKEECQACAATESDQSIHSSNSAYWRRNGTSFPVEYWSHPVYKDKNAVGTVVTFVDITERKLIEEELLRHRDNLEELVSERTIELQRLNKELETFSYSVSHDLRAPLRAIDGFSQALMEDYAEVLDETASDYLERVRGASQKMSGLIDDMLKLSRITRSDLVKEKVDLSHLANDAVESLRFSETDRNIDVVIEPDLVCFGDKKMLAILMNNLIENAWKFTGKNEITEIRVGKQNIDNEEVFFVKDNGAGFDMEFAHKLFGVFQRLHTADEFSGTGVGLATVYRILSRHGGKIWAESAVGEGATFYFVLQELTAHCTEE